MSHKKNIFKNTITMFICFSIQTIFGFLIRKAMIDSLGLTILGYNAVFNNVLTLLNLSELGIGISANAFLYKAISENNTEEISSICSVLKKLYRYVVLFITIFGIIISIFLIQLIPNQGNQYINIYIYYYLFLFSTIASYFVAYKKTLIISDQKNYVISIIESSSYIIISIIELFILYIYKSYSLFLILNILKNILSGVIIYKYYIKHYTILMKYEGTNKKLEEKYKKQITGEIKNIFLAKIGGVVFHGTDSIIVSSILGTIPAGLLSNYTMITTTLQNLITQIFSSIQATIGHFTHTEKDINKQLEIYNVSFLCAFIFGLIAMEGIIYVLPNLISFMFGKDLLLSNDVNIILGINLMLMILLQVPNQIFAIYKLYKYDKYIVLISAILNIVISIVLVFNMGLKGVLIGTTIALLIYLFSRCYIIKKYIYTNTKYIKNFLLYFIVSIITTIIIYLTNTLYINDNFIIGILLNSIYVVIICSLIILLCFCKNNEFLFIVNKLKHNKN